MVASWRSSIKLELRFMGEYEKSTETFVNPYYFVPLEDKCSKNESWEDLRKEIENGGPDLKIGWLECELTVKTPLFVPNTTNPDAFGKKDASGNPVKSYEFFSYDNLEGKHPEHPPRAPVIPGSEIRGTIRSVFEAFTNSCMAALDEEKVLYKRVTSPAPDIGLVSLDKARKAWFFTPGEKVKIPLGFYRERVQRVFAEGQEIYFSRDYDGRIKNVNDKPFNDSEKGYVHHGEKFRDRKRFESILLLNGSKPERLDKVAVENLLENFKLYKDKTVNSHIKRNEHAGYPKVVLKRGDRLDLDGVVAYRIKHGGKDYLCPAQIGREVFYNTIKTLVKDYSPCDDSECLCPACLLFGFVAGEKTKEGMVVSLGSRVRFSDAILISTPRGGEGGDSMPVYHEPLVLPELSGPKPSAVEFYLKCAKGADVWNYDYAFNWNGNKPVDAREYTPAVKGRKFYWHHKNLVKPPGITDEEISERHVGVRPLATGHRFKIKVFFNSITTRELQRLGWVLELGGSPTRAHKMGMGKPVGLGSVQLSITKAMIRSITAGRDAGVEGNVLYKILPDEAFLNNLRSDQEPWEMLGCTKATFDEFWRGLEFDNAPDNVAYPSNVGDPAVYSWFVANRNAEKGKGTQPVINQPLQGTANPHMFKYKKGQRKVKPQGRPGGPQHAKYRGPPRPYQQGPGQRHEKRR